MKNISGNGEELLNFFFPFIFPELDVPVTKERQLGGKIESEMLLVICLSISRAADVGKQTTHHVVNTFSFFPSMNLLFLSEKPISNVTNRISSFLPKKLPGFQFSHFSDKQIFYQTKYIEFCTAKRLLIV